MLIIVVSEWCNYEITLNFYFLACPYVFSDFSTMNMSLLFYYKTNQ